MDKFAKNTIDEFAKVGYFFDAAGCVLFVILVYLLLRRKDLRNVTIAGILFVFCTLMGNPDRFKKLSLSLKDGVQTEAWDTIREARFTIEQLQRLATALGEASLNELAFSGQIFVGMTTEEKFRLRTQIVERLSSIGITTEEMKKTQRTWIYVYCGILKDMIEAAMMKRFPSADIAGELRTLSSRGGQDRLPTPSALWNWLATRAPVDPYVAELIKEYDIVSKTGAMNNADLIPFGTVPHGVGIAELPSTPATSNSVWKNGGFLTYDRPAPPPP